MDLDPARLGLDPEPRRVLEALYARLGGPPRDLETMWTLLDLAWNDLGCSAESPDPACLAAFYRHPVWVANGRFVEQDPESRRHRAAVCRWLAARWQVGAGFRLLDYGGGEAVLAAMVARRLPAATVDVYEPLPSPTARRRALRWPRVRFVNRIGRAYDLVISTDVLEHLPDPLGSLAAVANALRPGGTALIAANFYPVVRCHLPGTFYLRYTLPVFAWALGLDWAGRCPGSPAAVYRRRTHRRLAPAALRRLERLARNLFPAMAMAHRWYRRLHGGPRRQDLEAKGTRCAW